jgi:S-DNA-T family DNA segregation ATPase FtsK/SpoIIIE
MAKKKKSKDAEASKFTYSVELTGLILILIGLIGFGFGPVGTLIKKFAMFLLGEWWPAILILVLFLGFFMLIKRKLPNFFSAKLIGIYIFIIVILVMSHFTFIKECESASDIFKATIDNYMLRVASIGNTNALATSGQTSIVIGGGIVGAVFSFGSASLFGASGTYIVLAFMSIFGLILIFNINLGNMLNGFVGSLKELKPEKKEKTPKEDHVEVYDYEEDQEFTTPVADDRIVVSSVEELRNYDREQPKIETTSSIKEDHVMPNTVASDDGQGNISFVNADYHLPSMNLLDNPEKPKKTNSNQFIISNKQNLERVLKDFQIAGRVVDVHMGPSVTQYEVVVPSGTKVSRIVGINKEIALALAAKDVRIQAPIPGKSTIGVEIPNPVISAVKIKEILGNIPKAQENAKMLVALGKDIMGRPQTADLSKMPHLLVAGSTGSGKSVCVNSMLASLLMLYRPDQVKIMLVDPKKVELSNYNGVPHLLCPVVTDPKKASLALQKIVVEMEKRYDTFAETGVKNIGSYNEYIEEQNKLNPSAPLPKMYYILVVIDELADLMLVASKEVEESIMRITQMARAAGIHLIVATQRPSTDVITGVVKANIPSRISFAVSSQIDSRTILDMPGGEKLLGKGDMLYLPMGENTPIRIQGCFISDDEIRRVIEYVCKEQQAKYDENLTTNLNSAHIAGADSEPEEYDDPLYNEVVEFAAKTGKISASLLQRRFRLGYNRAARIVDLLEERGIIGPQNGSKPREVLIKLENKNEEEA